MIEFAILFGLGFLSAVLLALMLAPAIHRRIVAYTEKRIFATMPISPQEVRAQKDMARAVYAAENARLRQELDEERQRAITLRIRRDEDISTTQAIEVETKELKTQVQTLETEVQTLQEELSTKQKANEELSSQLKITEEVAAERAKEIQTLSTKVQQISRDLGAVKIELAAREVEAEQERAKAHAMKVERDAMSRELIGAEAKNKEAANQITRESRKVTALEMKLAEKAAKDADNETLLERRAAEIARLKERLRSAVTEAQQFPTTSSGTKSEAISGQNIPHGEQDVPADTLLDNPAYAEDLKAIRQHSEAIASKLTNLNDDQADESLREELAELAAKMVALTAKSEGETSPILSLLKDTNIAANDSSLAARTKRKLEGAGV